MQNPVEELLAILDLEPIEVNIFRGTSPDENRQRVFGGQVAGQALVAAARTVETGLVHSLHAYFLRPGDPTVPILYEVERIRDGRSFTTRRVRAIQHGKAIFHLSASFHSPEPGMEHQMPMPSDAGDPEDLPDWRTQMEPLRKVMGPFFDRPRPIDLRWVGRSPADRSGPAATEQKVWMRATGRLPDDPVIHTCVLTYASDMSLLDCTLRPHGFAGWDASEVMTASLDHAMWFHRPFRADEWLLYVQDTPSSSDARGIARGLIYTQSGDLAVSVVQEGLIRPVGERARARAAGGVTT
ncbi:MAG: acyl-CoA thioesterase II [Actinomycetota bacterium]|nr:acyl-CoA thioesterase II [Actinomycetota bacterium]